MKQLLAREGNTQSETVNRLMLESKFESALTKVLLNVYVVYLASKL